MKARVYDSTIQAIVAYVPPLHEPTMSIVISPVTYQIINPLIPLPQSARSERPSAECCDKPVQGGPLDDQVQGGPEAS